MLVYIGLRDLKNRCGAMEIYVKEVIRLIDVQEMR